MPERRVLRRTTLMFRLSNVTVQRDLVLEFALHEGIDARAHGTDHPELMVDAVDNPATLWDVRATVGMFDDRAVEMARGRALEDQP